MAAQDVIWFSDAVGDDECPMCGVGLAAHSDLTCVGGCCFCNSNEHVGIYCDVVGPCEKLVDNGRHSPSCLQTHRMPVKSSDAEEHTVKIPAPIELFPWFLDKVGISEVVVKFNHRHNFIRVVGPADVAQDAEARIRRRLLFLQTHYLGAEEKAESGRLEPNVVVDAAFPISLHQWLNRGPREVVHALFGPLSIRVWPEGAAANVIRYSGPRSRVEAAIAEFRRYAATRDCVELCFPVNAHWMKISWLIGTKGVAVNALQDKFPGLYIKFDGWEDTVARLSGPAAAVEAGAAELRRRIGVPINTLN